MERVVRACSESLFFLNYGALIAGGVFTFSKQSDRKSKIFYSNAAIHCVFCINTFVLAYLKLRAFPYHLSCQLVGDIGCSVGCLPTYLVWCKHDYIKFLQKKPSVVESIDENMSAEQIVQHIHN